MSISLQLGGWIGLSVYNYCLVIGAESEKGTEFQDGIPCKISIARRILVVASEAHDCRGPSSIQLGGIKMQYRSKQPAIMARPIRE